MSDQNAPPSIIRAAQKNGRRFSGTSSKKAVSLELQALQEYITGECATKAVDAGVKQREDEVNSPLTLNSKGPKVLEPPYNMQALRRMPDNSSILRQCIAAMVTNIEGNGYRLEYVGPKGKQTGPTAIAEKEKLVTFLDNINGDYSLTDLRQHVRSDYETLGNGYIEVIRNGGGDITALYHIAAYTMRVCSIDQSPVSVEVVELAADGKWRSRTVRRKFRRYVQRVNGADVYFKEFGDPRVIDPKTGEENTTLALEDSATEIKHFAEYNPGTPYGLPRWFAQIPVIMGLREAELTNLSFFTDNAMPAMAVLVSGGYLPQENIDNLYNQFNMHRGRKAHNDVVIIEAAADLEAADDSGKAPVPKIELKPLVGERQQDGQFLEYDKECRAKIRSAFRLPPIFLGLTDDYTRATSDNSMIMAEAQVFGPERRKIDDFIDRQILSQFRPKYWRFKSNPPRVAGTYELVEVLKGLNQVGALTPNAALSLTKAMIDLDIEPFKDSWADQPMFLTQAQTQNGIDPNNKQPVADATGQQPDPAQDQNNGAN